MAANTKNPTAAKGLMTPKGIAVFPHLTVPSTKFKAEGEYSTRLRLTPEEAAPLIATLTPLHEAAIQEGREKDAQRTAPARKKNPFQVNDFFEEELDADGNPTGNLLFNFKMSASGVSKKDGKPWTRKPVLFDAGLKPINPDKVRIWSGSTIRVKFDTCGYFIAGTGAAGLGLYLQVVQVIDLCSGGADASGFEAEEDGYSYADSGDPYTASEPAAANDQDGAEAF